MRRFTPRSLRLVLTALLAATVSVLVAAPGAEAVTYARTASSTYNAYSINSYKAKVWPYKSATPSGYTVSSRVLTAYNSAGAKVASGVSSKWLPAGTYSVYSKSTFRQGYTTKVNQTYTVASSPTPYSCVVNTSQYDSSVDALAVGVSCNAYDDRNTKIALTATGYAPANSSYTYTAGTSVSGYTAVDDWLWNTEYYYYAGQDGLMTSVTNAADAKVGTSVTTTVTKTLYRYKTAYSKRTVYVKKIYNPPVCSWAEYKSVYYNFDGGGDSLALVRRIIGSSGTRTSYSSSDGDVIAFYQWKNSEGGTVSVGFFNDEAYTKSWWS
jgi:hypothetical protein